MKRLAALFACFSIGCASAPKAPTEPPIAATPSPPSRPELPWRTVQVTDRLFVELPAASVAVHRNERVAGKEHVAEGFEIVDRDSGTMDYSIVRYIVERGGSFQDEPGLLGVARQGMDPGSSDVATPLGLFAGLTVRGTSRNEAVRSRAVLVGRFLYVARVHARADALDERAADHFLSSMFDRERPMVISSAEAHYSFVLPSSEWTLREKKSDSSTTHYYALGGPHELWVIVTASHIADPNTTPDTLLERVLTAYAKEGDTIVRMTDENVAGSPSRDVTARTKGDKTCFRNRMIVADGKLFEVLVSAKDQAAFADPMIAQIVETFRPEIVPP